MIAIIEQPVELVTITDQAQNKGGAWTFNYLVGAIITAPFVPPVAALFAILFVLALISDHQFDERIEALEQATEPTEQTAAAGAVVTNGCSWIVVLAVVSFGGAFLLMTMGVG